MLHDWTDGNFDLILIFQKKKKAIQTVIQHANFLLLHNMVCFYSLHTY